MRVRKGEERAIKRGREKFKYIWEEKKYGFAHFTFSLFKISVGTHPIPSKRVNLPNSNRSFKTASRQQEVVGF